MYFSFFLQSVSHWLSAYSVASLALGQLKLSTLHLSSNYTLIIAHNTLLLYIKWLRAKL